MKKVTSILKIPAIFTIFILLFSSCQKTETPKPHPIMDRQATMTDESAVATDGRQICKIKATGCTYGTSPYIGKIYLALDLSVLNNAPNGYLNLRLRSEADSNAVLWSETHVVPAMGASIVHYEISNLDRDAFPLEIHANGIPGDDHSDKTKVKFELVLPE